MGDSVFSTRARRVHFPPLGDDHVCVAVISERSSQNLQSLQHYSPFYRTASSIAIKNDVQSPRWRIPQHLCLPLFRAIKREAEAGLRISVARERVLDRGVDDQVQGAFEGAV